MSKLIDIINSLPKVDKVYVENVNGDSPEIARLEFDIKSKKYKWFKSKPLFYVWFKQIIFLKRNIRILFWRRRYLNALNSTQPQPKGN